MSTTRRVPTRDELRIWREYIETADALRSALGARLQSDSGLSSGDYTVLLALSEADGRQLRSSALAAQIGWERSRLSHHLGRMERRGLIAREDCPTDNRGAEIVLTAAGATVFEDSNGPHLRAIREVFVDALTPEQLAAAGEVASALRVHLTDQTDRITWRAALDPG
jgi:DNA-binding MarR family transcriptional regulator